MSMEDQVLEVNLELLGSKDLLAKLVNKVKGGKQEILDLLDLKELRETKVSWVLKESKDRPDLKVKKGIQEGLVKLEMKDLAAKGVLLDHQEIK